MALIIEDRVKVTSISTGSGPLTLGDAVSGFQSFEDAGFVHNNQAYCAIVFGSQWEVSLCRWTSDNILYRDGAVEASSNSGDLVDFGPGAKQVFLIQPATLMGAHTGDVTKPNNSNVTTIAANAVTNTKLAKMAALTFKANTSGALADPQDITDLAMRAALSVVARVVSVSALRLLDAAFTDTVVMVLAYYSGGLEGGGLFVVDPADTTSGDNSGTIIISADGRRWKRQYDGGLSPAWFGALGDGIADDTAALQATINEAESLSAGSGGTRNVVIDLGGQTYLTTDELIIDSGTGLTVQNGALKATDSAVWAATNYTKETGTDTDVRNVIRTNDVLWNRNLTNAAWTKTNVTAAMTATGLDGVANSATRLTATAGNGTVLQAITSASALRVGTFFVRRVTGAGNIQMTMDGGGTWTTLANPPMETTIWTQYSIPPQTLANPSFGFRIVTNGDAIDVDYGQLESITAGDLPFSTSPMLTTTAAVTRTLPATYMIRVLAGAQSTTIFNCFIDCNTLTGGIYVLGFNTRVLTNRINNVRGIGVKQEVGGVVVQGNLISGNFLPYNRNSIGIYAAQADGKFFGNISRYHLYPMYLGNSEEGAESGSTGLYLGNHFYNGHASIRPESHMILADAGNSNIFVGGYLDDGYITMRGSDMCFWNNRVAWGNTSARSLFTFYTETAASGLSNFFFNGLEYPSTTFAADGATVFALKTKGAGTWTGLNQTQFEALSGAAFVSGKVPTFYSTNGLGLAVFEGTASPDYITLKDISSTNGVKIGVDVDDMVLATNNTIRTRISSTGALTHTTAAAGGVNVVNSGSNSTASAIIQGSRAADGSSFAEIRFQNRAGGGTVTGESALRFHRRGDDDAVRMVLELEDAAGVAQDHLQASELGLQGLYKTTVVNSNAAFTLTAGGNRTQVFHTGTLTANRAVTLATVDVDGNAIIDGATFRITRTGGGAFTLDIGTGPLKSLATNTWCEVVWDAANTQWRLAQYGAL